MTVEMLYKYLQKQMMKGNREVEISVRIDGRHQTVPVQEVNHDDGEIVLEVNS